MLDEYSHWSERKECALVVVGGDWTPAERQTLERLGVASQVKLLTGVDDARLCRLYNRAAAFVLPSLCEGFGIPLLEAMTSGCPIVASQIPSTLEVAGDCPLYFDLAQPGSLRAMLDQVRAEGRSSERVRKGLERSRQFSWERTARQTLEVYRSFYV